MDELSILAGIIGSDGHLSKDNSTICVINKDMEFLTDIAIPLLSKYSDKEPKVRYIDSGFGSKKYLVRVCNSKLLKDISRKYNIPIGSKSVTILPPENLDISESLFFISGWIAGDGSVTKDRTRPKIEIWSKSAGMLHWFKDVFDYYNIGSTIFHARKNNEFILRIGRKNDVIKFHKSVRIPHPAKQRKLDLFLSYS